jgi:hypothetical protein
MELRFRPTLFYTKALIRAAALPNSRGTVHFVFSVACFSWLYSKAHCAPTALMKVTCLLHKRDFQISSLVSNTCDLWILIASDTAGWKVLDDKPVRFPLCNSHLVLRHQVSSLLGWFSITEILAVVFSFSGCCTGQTKWAGGCTECFQPTSIPTPTG